ncbi:voltage-dependent calcium channel type A subunit alpha-1-like isoform X1 [Selaginella moellendorffii]|uniref:voltage-dependent calcium channel type A subunit alpha-1-like isoform X1 n=1 Tax=Selaginella moellendorffii TaxID=88036 RepID=UPI000D1CC707|nr:voltage-dependent calcium channel type A subunit alpha-1-like isoform X1 [Selaginella moellendorffii]|eukprot:XP_024544232.1 voltage-dependent calcium channel type A subunit alpha-1-like isoform X1 [Selaginella moellendorffii]
MVLRISALGFIKGRHCCMRNPYNRLDFVIVFDSWVHIIARGVTGHDFFARIAVFRVFRGLLALKHVTFFADGIPIMAAVKKGVGPLQNVILLTFFLLVFYSLLGTQFLQNSMNQRCFRTADKKLAYPMRFCDKKAAGGYVCPPFQNCMTYENPNHGTTTFDYLWASSNRKSFQLAEYEELERTLTTIQRPWYLREGRFFFWRGQHDKDPV